MYFPVTSAIKEGLTVSEPAKEALLPFGCDTMVQEYASGRPWGSLEPLPSSITASAPPLAGIFRYEIMKEDHF